MLCTAEAAVRLEWELSLRAVLCRERERERERENYAEKGGGPMQKGFVLNHNRCRCFALYLAASVLSLDCIRMHLLFFTCIRILHQTTAAGL